MMILSDELQHHVTRLLDNAGFVANHLRFIPCAKGGNNRTFRIEADDNVFAMKEYFRQPGDTRDRLASEFAFLQYAYQVAPESVPFPYAKDAEEGLALYEFIEGSAIAADDVQAKDVDAAATFFCALNQPALKQQASDLSLASEACFSIHEHIQLIDARITKLQQLMPNCDEDLLAEALIKQLGQCWDKMIDRIQYQARVNHLDLSQTLLPDQRCISPSDFGFHNALRISDGRLRFLDFEYAGWDDPAKMVGDFFSQLAIPVPAHYFESFTEKVMQPFSDASMLIERARILRPVYQIKWCCIALNVFIPVNLARRKFANPALNIVELKHNQILKAKSLLNQLEI